MKRNARKLCAVMLVVSMLFSLLPGAAFAASANGNGTMTEIPFTSSADLVKQITDQLVAAGNIQQPQKENAVLANAVEQESGKSLSTVKTAIGLGLFSERNTGMVDTSAYNLTVDQMDQVMDLALRETYLTNAIGWEYETENGVVTAIKYDMRDSLVNVFNEMDESADQEKLNAIADAAVAEADIEPINENTADAPKMRLFSDGRTTYDVEPTCNHAHVTSVEFEWIRTQTPVINEETKEPEGALYYGPQYNPETGEVEDSEKRVRGTVKMDIDYTCTATFVCEDCKKKFTLTTEDGLLIEKTTLGEEVLGTENVLNYKSTLYTAAFSVEQPDGSATTYTSAPLNVTKQELQIAWAQLTEFIEAYPQYYGVVTPYWLSKDTEQTPMGAMKSLFNMQTDDFIPDADMLENVSGMTQAFMSYVYAYADVLDAVCKDAMKEVDKIDAVFGENGSNPDSTKCTLYKLMVLHDWLANQSSFDMDGISQGPSDPIVMTAFGTMLPFTSTGDLGNGSLCVGYAASYNMLVQHAFPELYKNEDGSWKTAEEMQNENSHIIDFVQIRFDALISECSVAGSNSGFSSTDEDRFTQPHYFNAVKVDDNWYYIDACYDDISPEVVSQCRVETDGNLSHMYFLMSPQTLADQFEGKYSYIDSLYDGGTYPRSNKVDEDGNQVYDENGAPVYEWGEFQETEEKGYDDDRYEDTWFSSVESQIILYDGYWYYVKGQNSYASIKKMAGQMGDSGDSSMDKSEMIQLINENRTNPDYADQLRRRAINQADVYESQGSSGMGALMNEDPYAEDLFHFGYGYAGTVENPDEETDYGFKTDLDKDKAYSEMYPDLNHSIGIYGDTLYFNLANKVMTYDLTETVDNSAFGQLKEYNDVYAASNGKPFTGMSFVTTNGNYVFHVHNYPLASVSVHDETLFSETENADGVKIPAYAGVQTNFYATVATNLTNTNLDENKKAYVVEAVNYNPDYNRYLADDATDDEGNKIVANDNSEFMWSANVVEKILMSSLLADLQDKENYKQVSVDAYCDEAGFTDLRSSVYGLSDGSEKVYDETKPETGHNDKWHSDEINQDENAGVTYDGRYICEICHRPGSTERRVLLGDVNGDGKVSAKDYALLKKYILDKNLVEIDLNAADMSGDGKVTAKDYALIKQEVIESNE